MTVRVAASPVPPRPVFLAALGGAGRGRPARRRRPGRAVGRCPAASASCGGPAAAPPSPCSPTAATTGLTRCDVLDLPLIRPGTGPHVPMHWGPARAGARSWRGSRRCSGPPSRRRPPSWSARVRPPSATRRASSPAAARTAPSSACSRASASRPARSPERRGGATSASADAAATPKRFAPAPRRSSRPSAGRWRRGRDIVQGRGGAAGRVGPPRPVAAMSAPVGAWSTAEVKRRLEEAALTLARLPDPDRRFRRRLTALWPAAPRTTPGEDFARGVERLEDAMPDERPRSRLVVTDPGAVERMHDCIGWLAWIPDRKRRFIVWAKAAGPVDLPHPPRPRLRLPPQHHPPPRQPRTHRDRRRPQRRATARSGGRSS